MRLNMMRTLWGVMKGGDGPLEVAEALPKLKGMGYVRVLCGCWVVGLFRAAGGWCRECVRARACVRVRARGSISPIATAVGW